VQDKITRISIGVVALLGIGFFICVILSSKAVAVVSDNKTDVRVTYQNTVSGLFDELGIPVGSNDMIISEPGGTVISNLDSRLKSGMQIKHTSAIPFVLDSDGGRKELYATKQNIRDIVSKEGIKLGPLDRVEMIPDPQNPGRLISRVIRVEHKIVKVKTRIPYEITYTPNAQVERGNVIVWKPGTGGEREDSYRQVFENGKLKSSTFVSSRISKKPISEEQAVGEGDLPGGALEVYTMDSTAYSPTVEECDGDPWTTATGMKSGYGVVAVDPHFIPYFTKLYVEGYGYAIAGDCGSAIQVNRLDVFFYRKEEAFRWGRRRVRVYVLEWPKGAKR
jgi:3D (Asp-Asp-Asp) domain-containing protein